MLGREGGLRTTSSLLSLWLWWPRPQQACGVSGPSERDNRTRQSGGPLGGTTSRAGQDYFRDHCPCTWDSGTKACARPPSTCAQLLPAQPRPPVPSSTCGWLRAAALGLLLSQALPLEGALPYFPPLLCSWQSTGKPSFLKPRLSPKGPRTPEPPA